MQVITKYNFYIIIKLNLTKSVLIRKWNIDPHCGIPEVSFTLLCYNFFNIYICLLPLCFLIFYISIEKELL